MAIDDVVSRMEVYKLIVGKQIEGPPSISDFDVHPEKVDEVYLLAKKMQRVYGGINPNINQQYYSRSFKEIESAYLSKDMAAFKKAVRSLMEDIAFD